MPPPSPARLYAALVGAGLMALGMAGFFYDLSWLNFLYAGTGALGLVAAGRAPRLYALAIGLLYTGIAIVDFSTGPGWLHLALGVLGLAAVAGTPGPGPREGSRQAGKRWRSEARAEAAAQRP
jgi:hypothetical protein